MRKKILNRVLIGFPIGISIGLFFSIVFCYLLKLNDYFPAPPRFMDQFQSSLNAMLISVIIWGLIGSMFSCTSLFFTETDWSITKMTVMHFCISYILFVPLSLIAGWYPTNYIGIIIFTIYYIIFYVLTWIISMLKTKYDLKQLNAKL